MSSSLLIYEYLLAVICQAISRGRIPNELPNAVYRIANPQLVFLCEKLAFFVL
jgi:hypothetical protein